MIGTALPWFAYTHVRSQLFHGLHIPLYFIASLAVVEVPGDVSIADAVYILAQNNIFSV